MHQLGENFTLQRCGAHYLRLGSIIIGVLCLCYLVIWTLIIPLFDEFDGKTTELTEVLWYCFSAIANLVFTVLLMRSPLVQGEPQIHLLVLMCAAQVGLVYCVVLERSRDNDLYDDVSVNHNSDLLYSFEKTFLVLSSFSFTVMTSCRCFTKYLITTCSTVQRVVLTLLMLSIVSCGIGFMANTDRTATWFFVFIAPILVTLFMVVHEGRQLDAGGDDGGHHGYYADGGIRFRTIVTILLLRTVLTVPFMITRFMNCGQLPNEYSYRLFLWNSLLVPFIVASSEQDLTRLFFIKVCGFTYDELNDVDELDDATSSRREPFCTSKSNAPGYRSSPISNAQPPLVSQSNYGSITPPKISPAKRLECVAEEEEEQTLRYDDFTGKEQTSLDVDVVVMATADDDDEQSTSSTMSASPLPFAMVTDNDGYCRVYGEGEMKTIICDD